jgi:hypothetical protein
MITTKEVNRAVFFCNRRLHAGGIRNQGNNEILRFRDSTKAKAFVGKLKEPEVPAVV